MLLAVFLSVAFLIAVIILVTRHMTGSIKNIVAAMKKAGAGDLAVRVRRDRKMPSEMETITDQFNRMMGQMNKLVEEVKMVSARQKDAEITALEAQINPHFLYNTLDSIYWYSLSDRQRDIGNVVQHLAKMLRIALSKGSEYIPVERELQHVANYLEIESTIYQGRFTYEVEADPAVMSCTVLKILLQPLAENSITHGFANMERGGHIRVQVGQDADDLVLSVTDNGCGFPQEERTDAHTSEYSGFALKNLESRLQLHYGADARVLIHSIPTEKTTVTIKIRKSRVNSEDV